MEAVKKPLVSHVSKKNVERGIIALKKTAKDEEFTPCAFVRVNSLHSFIEHIIESDTAGFNEHPLFKNKWWIFFSGDKGGSHKKFHVESKIQRNVVQSITYTCI